MNTKKLPISAVIISTAEGEKLIPTLQSLNFVDDVLVLLSEKDECTESICSCHGARVAVQDWLGFGAQKNCAAMHAKHDWVLSVDSDEVVDSELASSIQSAFNSNDNNAYRMRRINHFLGRALYHGEGGNDWLVRLYHRKTARWTDSAVHERLALEPNVKINELSGALLHFSATDLSEYVHKQIRYAKLSAETLLNNGVHPANYHLVLNPWVRFFRFYLLRRGFLDGISGFAHITLGSFSTFMKYLFLYQKKQEKKAKQES